MNQDLSAVSAGETGHSGSTHHLPGFALWMVLGLGLAMLALLSKLTSVPPEARFVVVKEMNSTGEGAASPSSGLVADSGGTLYGVTEGGGKFAKGTLLGIRADGSEYQILHSFGGEERDGAIPCGELVLTPEGVLLGTTLTGGAGDLGTIFRINTDGSGYRLLYSFSTHAEDGLSVIGGLTLGTANAAFGTACQGGRNQAGTVFRIDFEGRDYGVLHHFDNATGDGANPLAGVTVGSDGALYGTASRGGDYGLGTVYRLAPDGSEFAVLHSFGEEAEDGTQPRCKLLARDGVLYGTTSSGGTVDCGTVFRLKEDGTEYSVLRHFRGGGGCFPFGGLIQGSDGGLYGTAMGGANLQGTVYRLNRNGGGIRLIHTFGVEECDGTTPCFALLAGADGVVYGVCRDGGRGHAGTLYSIRISSRFRH